MINSIIEWSNKQPTNGGTMKKLTLLFTVLFLCAWSTQSFAQKVNVTFKVNMKVQQMKGNFDPTKNVVTIPGGFNNWLNEPPANTDKTMTGPDADGVYTKTIQVDVNKTYEYKYNIGLGWDGKDELGGKPNRSVAVGTTDVVLPVVFFNNELMPSGASANVTFKVDMRMPFKQRRLDKVTGKVFVAGDLNGWSTTANQLAGPAADSTYSAVIPLNSGQLIHYKFLYNDNSGGTTWEGGFATSSTNREDWIVDGTQTISKFWDDTDPTAVLKDGSIIFMVDMSVLTDLKVFDPATDRLVVRGAFNGWSDSDPGKSNMFQDPINPTNFFNSIPFVNEKVGAEQTFKYKMDMKTPPPVFTKANGDAQYERPFSTTGGNRKILFAGTVNQTPPLYYFNDIRPEFVIPAGKTLTINFKVDMADAKDAAKTAQPLNPATDTVYVRCGQAAWAHFMGWNKNPDGEDQDRAVKLTSTDGRYYTGSVQISGPAFNGFMYVYEYAHKGTDGAYTMLPEETSFGNGHRVRFIPMTQQRTFVQPYTPVTDTWVNAQSKPGQVEDWPLGLPTAVEDADLGIPSTFELAQNYPNPFNPTTKIKFTIPSEEMVSLKIFNVLGQEVTTLLNQQMKAGSYSFEFNASKLSTGVYFYRIEAGSYNETKKMMLIK